MVVPYDTSELPAGSWYAVRTYHIDTVLDDPPASHMWSLGNACRLALACLTHSTIFTCWDGREQGSSPGRERHPAPGTYLLTTLKLRCCAPGPLTSYSSYVMPLMVTANEQEQPRTNICVLHTADFVRKYGDGQGCGASCSAGTTHLLPCHHVLLL